MTIGSRDVACRREIAEEALRDYADALLFWNAPDDEHTRIQIRRLAETALEEAFAERRSVATSTAPVGASLSPGEDE